MSRNPDSAESTHGPRLIIISCSCPHTALNACTRAHVRPIDTDDGPAGDGAPKWKLNAGYSRSRLSDGPVGYGRPHTPIRLFNRTRLYQRARARSSDGVRTRSTSGSPLCARALRVDATATCSSRVWVFSHTHALTYEQEPCRPGLVVVVVVSGRVSATATDTMMKMLPLIEHARQCADAIKRTTPYARRAMLSGCLYSCACVWVRG